VATGGKEDKPEVGARVVWSGVGRRIRSEHPSPRAVRRAVHRVLHDPGYREASRRIAADMADAPGVAGLTAIIDRLAVADAPTSDDDDCASAERRSAALEAAPSGR
jgi:UDP:flavonoid glycosyltransferase YjiC (YdhE family)